MDAQEFGAAFERLYQMAYNGDYTQMKMYIRKFQKENVQAVVNTLSTIQLPGYTPLQSTALLAACRQGHFQIVCFLVKDCQADVNAAGAVMFDNEVIEGSPPLWVAAAAGHKEICEFLLANGAQVNATTRSNSTPLRAACYDGHLSIVKLLIRHGADIEIANRHGHTSLMIACYRGHIEVAKFLLEKGAQVNRASLKGNTALHDASEAGHIEIIRVLLNNGAVMQADENNVTPILAAALCMNREIVNLLAQNQSGRYSSAGADAFELLGATVICKNSNLSLGIRYWKIAQSIRNSDPVNLSKKLDGIAPVEAYDNIIEFRSMEELDALSVEPYAVHLTALLIYERVLGHKHPDSYYYIRYRGAVLADGGDYHRCLIFWLRALDLQSAHLEPLCVLTQNNFVSFVELFSHIKRVSPDVFGSARPLIAQVFERLVAQMQRYVDRPAQTATGADGVSLYKTCACEQENDDDSPLLRCFNVALHLLSLLVESQPEKNTENVDDKQLKNQKSSPRGDPIDREQLKKFCIMLTKFVLPNGFNVLHAICHDQSVYDDFEIAQPPVATCVNRPQLLELAFEALGIGQRRLRGTTSAHSAEAPADPVDFMNQQQKLRRMINCPDVAQSTPLHYAATLRQPIIVERLLQAGASPSALNSMQETPLHVAAVACCSAEPVCCPEPLRLMLAAGGHPDSVNLSGRTPQELLASEDCESMKLFPSIQRLSCLAARALSKSPRAFASATRKLGGSLTSDDDDDDDEEPGHPPHPPLTPCLLHCIALSQIKLHQ